MVAVLGKEELRGPYNSQKMKDSWHLNIYDSLLYGNFALSFKPFTLDQVFQSLQTP
ncbi:hypothetical protein BWQ96_07390 [Gracilariopsis chorda]|uniref:Uncharacterized protein n=1 Tax=Gracilariopsis chorda TaxID=448386 RepID=A0A2V3ILB3_9FLOR|nr:hypothetical protein BWQ96_07390 [Gracilariopsis chorda]|eukprot:PXF42882.1 hypothetical protein BWQ96_07390 [Gracilariopsis chorda]